MSSSTRPKVPVFSLGERIRKVRADLALSQQQFADLLDFDRKTISNWEGERHTPSYGDLMLIASAADVSLEWLAGERFRPTHGNQTASNAGCVGSTRAYLIDGNSVTDPLIAERATAADLPVAA